MTREEAIEVYNGLINTKIKEAFEFFAPELRENESEDERIRKKCIEIIKRVIPNGDSKSQESKEILDCIAYLEKQKDCIFVPKSHLDPVGEPGVDGMKIIEKQKEQKNFQTKVQQRMEYLWDKLPDSHKVENGDCTPEEWKTLGAYMELEMNFDKDTEEEQQEQIPINNPKWNELTWKDINELEEIINHVHYEFRNGISAEGFGKEVLEQFRNMKEDVEVDACEQKPSMIQWKGDNLKEVIDFTGKSPMFDKWFKSFEEYEEYVHLHGNIFKLFNEDGANYEVPVGAWIVKTPDGCNVASKAVFRQKSSIFPPGIGEVRWNPISSVQQKPAELSEDDEDMIVDIIDIIQSDKAVAKIDPDHPASQERLAYYDKEITFLKSLLEGVKCRLKTEWSEEDDKAVYFINQFLEYHEASDPTAKSCKEWFNRFKSLRPQPKAEWSEEDEKIITRLIDYFESFRIAGVAIKWEGLDIQEVITLLKSLRPSWKPSEQEKGALRTAIYVLTDERSFPKTAAQLQNILNAFEGEESRKDWKPSKEQMEALSETIAFMPDTFKPKCTLVTLQNDLKKTDVNQ